jgi:GntR family transcriptional regulator, transcriptional repressor for pyruvate dehydrogenase complex
MGKIVGKKMSESVIDEIRRMITDGKLSEGDKLPNQNDFAQSLNVSRPSLREALQVLSWCGAIEQTPGHGTYLISRAPVFLASNLELPFMSDMKGTIELIETRRLFESGMIELAVVRATEKEIVEIGRVIKRMEVAVSLNKVGEYQEQDLIFHTLVARASHNRFIMHVFEAIQRSFEQFLKEAFAVMPDMMEYSMADHKMIYTALLNRDQKRAFEAMNSHILQVKKSIEAYFETKTESQ